MRWIWLGSSGRANFRLNRSNLLDRYVAAEKDKKAISTCASTDRRKYSLEGIRVSSSELPAGSRLPFRAEPAESEALNGNT